VGGFGGRANHRGFPFLCEYGSPLLAAGWDHPLPLVSTLYNKLWSPTLAAAAIAASAADDSSGFGGRLSGCGGRGGGGTLDGGNSGDGDGSGGSGRSDTSSGTSGGFGRAGDRGVVWTALRYCGRCSRVASGEVVRARSRILLIGRSETGGPAQTLRCADTFRL
ncbi:unnamed protein product, partial [Phaeothamnion confervicola]